MDDKKKKSKSVKSGRGAKKAERAVVAFDAQSGEQGDNSSEDSVSEVQGGRADEEMVLPDEKCAFADVHAEEEAKVRAGVSCPDVAPGGVVARQSDEAKNGEAPIYVVVISVLGSFVIHLLNDAPALKENIVLSAMIFISAALFLSVSYWAGRGLLVRQKIVTRLSLITALVLPVSFGCTVGFFSLTEGIEYALLYALTQAAIFTAIGYKVFVISPADALTAFLLYVIGGGVLSYAFLLVQNGVERIQSGWGLRI